jgi:hypothetical protein
LALDISDRAFVVDDGRIVHTCSAADLDADTDLKHPLWLFDPGRLSFKPDNAPHDHPATGNLPNS